MKKLTREEFIEQVEREAAIIRSQRIFIDSGFTKSLDMAFELYQRVLSETRRPHYVEQINGKERVSIFDTMPRPKCDLCGADMYLRFLPPNNEGVQSQGVCSECDNVLDFSLSHDEWVHLLSKEAEDGA